MCVYENLGLARVKPEAQLYYAPPRAPMGLRVNLYELLGLRYISGLCVRVLRRSAASHAALSEG